MEIRQLNFDVAKGGIQHRLFVRAGDVKSRTVRATFHSGGERIPFSSAYLRMITAGGAEKYNECTVADDGISYTFKSEELVPGEAMCEFVLTSADGGVMTSPKFTVVSEALLYDGDGAESSDEYAAYIAALMKIDNLTASVVGGEVPTVEVSEKDGGIHLAFALPRGEDGEDGHTPERGVDYWTDADKAEIKAYVDDQIGDIEGTLDGIIALQEHYIGGSV